MLSTAVPLYREGPIHVKVIELVRGRDGAAGVDEEPRIRPSRAVEVAR